MHALAVTFLFLGTAAFAQQAELVPGVPIIRPKDPGRSESASGQFTVHGKPLALRGTVASYLERRRSDFASLTGGRSDEWSLPVRVRLLHPDDFSGVGGAVSGVELIDGAGLRGVITVGLGREFRPAELDEALVGTLLAEIVLTGGRLPKREGEIVPPWLVAGVAEALEYRIRGRPGEVFRSIMDRGEILDIEKVLGGDPREGTPLERAVFRASSGALVLTLLGQPYGPEQFRLLLQGMRETGTGARVVREGLQKHFPTLRLSGDSLEKWWALEMASLAEPEAQEMMTAAATESALESALKFPLPQIQETDSPIAGAGADEEPGERAKGLAGWFRDRKKKGTPPDLQEMPEDTVRYVEGSEVPWVPVEDFPALTGRPDREKIVDLVQRQLVIVEMRAFPLLKPVVEGYREVLKTIAGGKTEGVAAALESLAQRRRSILASTSEVSSYLDWFEATQRDERSGEFDAYFRQLRRSGSAAEQNRTGRENRFSKALDTFEAGGAGAGKSP